MATMYQAVVRDPQETHAGCAVGDDDGEEDEGVVNIHMKIGIYVYYVMYILFIIYIYKYTLCIHIYTYVCVREREKGKKKKRERGRGEDVAKLCRPTKDLEYIVFHHFLSFIHFLPSSSAFLVFLLRLHLHLPSSRSFPRLPFFFPFFLPSCTSFFFSLPRG